MTKNILRNDIEYIIHCDSEGNIIGPISKTHAHLEGVRAVLTHYSTWSMIFHPFSNKYGIQLKNPKKHDKYSAGKWDMGAAGHNCYIKENGLFRPLDFDENLAKETEEEIGMKVKMCKSKKEFIKLKNKLIKPIGFIFDKFHYKTFTNNEWVGLGFIITPTIKVNFQDKEVIDFKWLTTNELKLYLKENNNYCAPLPLVFKKAEKFRKSLKNNE
ncbi:MAG: hypothetical protein U9O66_01955 [Patescibacteria group bacterium]|nr:hypothetical protein [Patescibacteria group bacterium]